jgi:hypothetical protein
MYMYRSAAPRVGRTFCRCCCCCPPSIKSIHHVQLRHAPHGAPCMVRARVLPGHSSAWAPGEAAVDGGMGRMQARTRSAWAADIPQQLACVSGRQPARDAAPRPCGASDAMVATQRAGARTRVPPAPARALARSAAGPRSGISYGTLRACETAKRSWSCMRAPAEVHGMCHSEPFESMRMRGFGTGAWH